MQRVQDEHERCADARMPQNVEIEYYGRAGEAGSYAAAGTVLHEFHEFASR